MELYAQNQISGSVRVDDTYNRIPFVAIGIDDKRSGTMSDSLGNFTLEIDSKVLLTDSVRFYHPDFEPLSICYNNLLNKGNRIYLTLKQASNYYTYKQSQQAVIVGKDQLGIKMLQANFFIPNETKSSQRVGREMGMIFKLKKNYMLKSANFYIGGNDYKKVKFRLSFYSVENGFPKDIIEHHDIVCSAENRYTGWINIDLLPYHIYMINRREVAVTLTILESELDTKRNLLSIIGSIKPNTLVIRDEPFDIWRSISGQTLAIYFECFELLLSGKK